jgi:hypothetical protein
VRNRLVRDERVPQVLRLSVSGDAFRAACAAEEAHGAALGVELWEASADEVIAAVPPASRRRLAQAGVVSEVLFESVGDWQRARTAGESAARRIEPYYQSEAAARDLVATVIVFDLSQSTLGTDDAARGLLDHESVLGRNASYLAYLQIVPKAQPPRDMRRRYTKRGLTVAGVFALAEFPKFAGRYFPETDTASHGGGAAEPMPLLDGAFHTYEEVETELRDLASRYPSIAKLISLGPTYEGREIWALKVSRDVDSDDPVKPDVLFTGCHHAAEWISVEPPVAFAHLLTEHYASDSTVRALVDHAENWLVPIVNPDGLAYSQSGTSHATDSAYFWRKNRRPIHVAGCGSGIGVDLNRNYPFMFRVPADHPCPAYDDDVGGADDPGNLDYYRGPEAASELEVQHLIALTGDPGRNFVARVDFHSAGQLVLYPADSPHKAAS